MKEKEEELNIKYYSINLKNLKIAFWWPYRKTDVKSFCIILNYFIVMSAVISQVSTVSVNRQRNSTRFN